MSTLNLASILLLLLLLIISMGGLYLFKIFKVDTFRQKKKTAKTNRQACNAIKRAIIRQNLSDYFWSDHMRAAWIMLFLLFSMAVAFSLAVISNSITSIISSLLIGVIFAIVTFFFVRFAIRSYKAFPEKAAQALKTFEEEIDASLKSEISFNGDNIQSFTDEDNEFDTTPKIFSFPAKITKVPFPPYETAAPKQPIVATKKVDFLVLSREYFSICKNVAIFNLLNPALGPEKKGCPKKKGVAGECHEHYYSQMRNVEYDSEKECIRIIYYDERDDVEFNCKKLAPNRKPAMKALKEKLRLTERQRLRKIDEHEKYENILNRREKDNDNEVDNN